MRFWRGYGMLLRAMNARETPPNAEPSNEEAKREPSTCSLPVSLRWLIRRDLPKVFRISSDQTGDCCWSELDLIPGASERNYIGMVAELGQSVVGYLIYQKHSRKLVLVDFVVAPEYRGRGVGRQMMDWLLNKVSRLGFKEIELVINERNLEGQKFLRRCGFQAVAVQRDHFKTGDDAYCMRLSNREQIGTHDQCRQ